MKFEAMKAIIYLAFCSFAARTERFPKGFASEEVRERASGASIEQPGPNENGDFAKENR
jgi:hypothetical protein